MIFYETEKNFAISCTDFVFESEALKLRLSCGLVTPIGKSLDFKKQPELLPTRLSNRQMWSRSD